ncbi:MFS transporter [Nitrospirillum sp. BR 11163]|uniref:MFS transporter n=1 Tax=Nitrospirillum sp. BR 11163 TaxID=3104323 RepID=UPI002AFE2A94|nr:MFS transporter [Nitrospirillum sp. BR 11163]MEA1672755.1 MFS transporter [Nitrospirillum sp. BR 11163]
MPANPLDAIAVTPMRLRQYVIVALCCLINVTEGYDMMSAAYTAPLFSAEWAVPKATLGLLFSMGSLGLALGAFVAAPLGERLGRRGVTLIALVAITVAHGLSSIAASIEVLMALRFLMGAGLGILVVSLNVLVSEFANNQRRNLMLSMLHTGFTIGMMIGGAVAGFLLVPYGWRSVYVFGMGMNAVLLLALALFMWESPTYLVSAQPRGALARINRILAGLGLDPLVELPPRPERARKENGAVALLAKDAWRLSVLMWLASFIYALVGYFLLNWKPTVLVEAGLTPTQASFSGVLQGIVGATGHLTVGAFSRRVGEARMTAIFFILMGAMLVLFGSVHAGVPVMIAMACVLTYFTVGAYTGVFLTAIALYPQRLRNFGVGFVVGFGRAGAVVGPLIGGLLLGADVGRAATFAFFAAMSAIPAVAMLPLSRKPGQPAPLTTAPT